MKRISILGAALLPLSLVAGFAQYLDTSALRDIPDELKNLSGDIAEYGSTSGNVWTPANVRANSETGALEINTDIPMEYFPMTLDDYVAFGTYDDAASIEAFMDRGSFWKTDKYGEQYLAYTSDDISGIYTQMEDANYNTFEMIVDEIEGNIENAMNSARQRGDEKSIRKLTKAMNALDRFYNSGVEAKSRAAAAAVNAFARKAKQAQSEYQRARTKHELLAAQNAQVNNSHLVAELKKLSNSLNDYIMFYMNDMNEIGAYLGSTNAMEYFSADMSKGITDEMTDRWFRFSPVERLDSGLFFGYSGDGTINTIFDTFASAYGMFAFDIEGGSKFADHFGIPLMSFTNHKGFYQTIEGTESVVTNWNAQGITAPYNWADGTTIKVKDGKFSVNNKVAVKVVGTDGSARYIGAPAPVTNSLNFASAVDSNVSVVVSGNSENVTVTIGVHYK